MTFKNQPSFNLIKNWASGLRIKTLGAALSPIFVAGCYSYSINKNIIFLKLVFAVLSALCIQIGTNFINDAFDFKKGTDRSDRLGPKRLAQSGFASFRAVLNVGLFFMILAVAFGIPLVFWGGWPIFLIGLVSIFMGYSYTAGPFSLAYRGWGDLFVIIFFGLVAVMGIEYLLNQKVTVIGFLLGMATGFLATTLIAINNLRDHEADKRSGRQTIPVRWGVRGAKKEIYFLFIVPLLFSIGLAIYFNCINFLMPALVGFWVIKLIRQISKTQPSEIYNAFLAKAGKIQLAWSFLMGISFLLCSR